MVVFEQFEGKLKWSLINPNGDVVESRTLPPDKILRPLKLEINAYSTETIPYQIQTSQLLKSGLYQIDVELQDSSRDYEGNSNVKNSC